jgi:hypothetical protein
MCALDNLRPENVGELAFKMAEAAKLVARKLIQD